MRRIYNFGALRPGLCPELLLAPALSDSLDQPLLHLALEPTDGARTNLDRFGESVLRLQLVDERSTEADGRADLSEPQNPLIFSPGRRRYQAEGHLLGGPVGCGVHMAGTHR